MKKEIIAIAMSGGVDSSVSAALLKERGYEVIGLTMHLWDNTKIGGNKIKGRCCSIEDIYDARRVAAVIDIPHYVINLEENFKQIIVDPFIDNYLTGKTPSPCILCNSHLKFAFLLEKAISLGATKLATGHYARVEYDEQRQRWLLKKGIDKQKDQSYFLFNLNQYQLSKSLFPLGNLTKKEVRILAEKYKLPVAKKAESQQLCFISNDNYRNFIINHYKEKIEEGNFISTDGKIIGKHKGLFNYTIGQRRKLGIAFGKPMFVVKINPLTNEIILGEEKELYNSIAIAEKVNWVSITNPSNDFKGKVRVRYKHEEASATIVPLDNNKIKVIFDEPQRAITPGQALVIYQEDILIGGGWIV